MPLFEYCCTKCGEKFEKIIFSMDREDVKCPKCKASEVERLMSSFSSCKGSIPKGALSGPSCGTSSRGFS